MVRRSGISDCKPVVNVALVRNSIALIACPNGLGHVHRVCVLGEQFAKIGWQATIFAPQAKFARVFEALRIEPKAFLIDFDAKFDLASISQGCPEAMCWEKRLPCLNDYDVVLSDNLPEILRIRKDAILSGNFFWHEVLPDISIGYCDDVARLIRESNPLLLSYGGFSVIEDLGAVQVHDCAIPTVETTRNSTSTRRKCLLVTTGTTDAGLASGRTILETLARTGIEPFEKVFVEPGLIGDFDNPEFFGADFSRDMFINVVATIGRPGFGAISDSFYYGSKFFPVVSENNREMSWNAAKLKEKGLGEGCLQACEAVQAAKIYAEDKTQQHIFQSNLSKFERENNSLPTAVDVVRKCRGHDNVLAR